VNPGLQEQANKLFAIGKITEGNKVLTDAVADAFDKMSEKAERLKQSAQGLTFFATLEQSLTPLGQYKGILASLETDFIKAFGASSDVVYILGARLREVFNSPEFQSGLTSLVSGIAAVASGMVSLTKWVVEHKEAVLLLAGAYLVLSTNVLRGLAMDAGAAALAVLTRGVLAMTTATVGLSAGAGLLATAKLAWASATVALTGTLAAAQIAAYNFWMALLAIPAAMVAIGVAIAAVVVGLGYLAYKWATAADSAEESAKKQRESLSESLKVAIEAGRLKNTSTAEQVATEIAEKEKLLTHLKNGLSQEEAANKAMGEMALVRIENTHREIMLHMALNAVKAKGAIFAMPGSDKHAAMSAEIDAASRAEILAQEKAMNSELAKQVTQTEKLRRINSEIAGWSRLKADQQRLVGKDDNIGYKGGNKPDFAKIKADKAEHDSAKGLIAEIKKEQQAAAKEIARYKAEAAQQTAAAAREEKREIAEITAAYLDGVEQRRVAAMEMESAVAAGSKSEVDGKNLLASLKLESNRAELAQIQAVMGASLKRYAEEFRAATLAHNLEKLRLEKSLSLQKQLAEQLKKKYGSDPSYAREIADAVGQVEVLQEQLKLWEVTTKEIDAASEKLLDTANKGTSDYTAKLREQDKALDEQLLASQRNVKSVQDELSNRAKGTAELRQEAAVKQAQHAFDMQAEADRLRMAGSESAVQAQKQADIARTAAAYLQLGITKDAAMSTDWYSATQKALKDYASSLENVAGEIANVFTKSFKGLEDVLTDFLTKGKADFKGFVKSILADLARIAVRQGIIGPMLGGFTSGMAGGGGGSMLGSLAGSAASSMMGGGASGGLLSGVGNTVGGWFGAGGGAAMAGANAAALSGAGTSLTGTLYTTAAMDSAAAYGAAGTSAGMASGGSMMGGISSAIGAIPVWGWALMAAAAIAAIAGKGETRSGGQYGYSTDGATVANARRGTTQSASGVGATFLEGPSGGTGDVAAVSLMNSAFKGINDLFKSLGSSETVSGFQSGYESSKNSRGGVFAGGTLASGKTFGESGKGDNYAGTLYEKTSAQTVSIEDAAKNYVTDLKQATVQAMQAATDLPKLIADKLKDLNAETMDDSALDALMGDIQNIIVSVNSFRDTLDTLPFTELRDMSFDAAAGLVQAVGGLDKLGTFTTNLSSYFDNFYSEEEKRKNTVKNITGTLNKAGLAVSEDQVNTATKETFRQVVEQYAAMGTEGQDVYLALLSVNQAFSDLSTATGSFLDDLKSYTESFSTKKELRSTAIKEITAKLNKNTSGVQVTDSMISSAGIKDFRAAVEATKAMGPAGRSAYESLLSVNQEFLALGNDQIKLDELLDTYGDLGSAADELVPPAEKLVDSWRNNKSAIQDLNDALDEALGTIKETTAAEKAVADVKKAVTNRDDLKEARKGINDTIDSIRLAAAKPADKVTLLKGKEAKLREEFAANPTATLFNKLTETTLARIKAEGELRQVNSDKEIAAQVKIDEMRLKSMQEQLSGFEALRDSAYELKQFVSDLKTGDLSALSPRDRLAEAKANFEETSRRAKAGDINAVNNLQGSAQTYLGVAKTNYGSATSQYASIFKDVTDNVTQIADYATGNASGTSAIDLQIEEAKKQVAALTTLASATVDTSKEEIAALTELGALADGAIEEMDKSILSLTEVAREQILLLQAVVDSQEIELKVQIEKHKELIAVLERIDENTDDTAATAVREASKV
jgi:lambda family phage tail tape measure protein